MNSKLPFKQDGSGIVCADEYRIGSINSIGTQEGKDNMKLVLQACNEHAALCAVAEAAKPMLKWFEWADKAIGEKPDKMVTDMQTALANLDAIRNPKPKLTEAEHNAFPKGRW